MSIRNYLEFSPQIAESAFIDSSAIVIGRVSIGAESSVWPLAVIRGDVHDISIGERTNIQDGSVIHATSPDSSPPDGYATSIGNDVTIGHKAVLHGCTINDRVLVGMGAIVLDGAVVEADVIIGAGSLVSPGKTLEKGGLYVGSPAKRVRELKKSELDFLVYSAKHYARLKAGHNQQG